MSTFDRQIYVACLAAYNNGKLHGEWIDASQSAEDIEYDIDAMLEKSPEEDAEEWAIHDHEGLGGHVGEYTPISRVADIAEYLDSAEDEAIAELCIDQTSNLDEAKEMLESYSGTYDDVGDYAADTTDDSDVPDHLKMYIDYDALGRDMNLNGDITAIELGYRKVAIFGS